MKTFTLAALITLTSLSSAHAADKEITLGRFFGACEDVPEKIADATGEACIIQSIITGFSNEKNGISVKTLPTDWGNYYDQIKRPIPAAHRQMSMSCISTACRNLPASVSLLRSLLKTMPRRALT